MSLIIENLEIMATQIKIWNGISKEYEMVSVITTDVSGWYERDGVRLIRIETKGKSGKTMYRSPGYISPKGIECEVFGMDGSTGHGWGGKILGYMTEIEITESGLKIK